MKKHKLIMFVVFIILALAVDLPAATVTSVTSGDWTDEATWSPAGVPTQDDDVTILAGHTVTISDMNSHPARNLSIGGILTHGSNGGSVEKYKINLIVTENLTIDINGSINVMGKGYKYGPGYMYGRGGTHGGCGGTNDSPVYGSATEPTSLGSGSQWQWGSTCGGGAIKISVGGTVTVDGEINADGQSASYAAAGGSVWIITDTLTGSGTISAKGGNGTYTGYGNGGGGGRIRIDTGMPENYLFTGDVLANGGTTAYYAGYRGHAGSVTFSDGTDIILYGTLHLGGASENTLGTLTVVTGSRLEFDGHPQGGYNAETGLYEGQGIVVNADSVDVQTGGIMSGLGLGFCGLKGPGYMYGRGGTHGGCGGTNNSPVYGSALEPTSLGSGSVWQWGNTSGGGAIKINAYTVTVDGEINADGQSSTYAGAGGSIWIIADTVTGSGAISAKGGNGSNNGGGGGRIRLETVAPENYLFAGDVLANGGSGGYRGHAGTVTFSDGTDITLHGTLHLGGASENTLGTLTVVTGSRLEFDGHPHGGYNAGTGLYEGQGIVINADSVDVQAGGIMSGLGLGFCGSDGAGYQGNRGGTHGGCGGTNDSPVYGSATEPTSLGSGSFFGAGVAKCGGGAIKINVSGTVNVDGEINADGQSSTYGGAGGSVWIIADTVEGAGVISAKGGNGNNGGGGGRIRIDTGMPENYLFTGDVLANGGTATTHDGYRGHAGSVTFSDGTDITLYGTLHLGGTSENTFGVLTVLSGGRLEFDGHPHGGYNAGTGLYEGQGIVINADSVDVQAGGVVSGLGLGFYGYEGPGAGWNRGGTHGGCGGMNDSPVYGSAIEPVSLGSGIAWTWGRKGGGGAIKINVSGTVNVDGEINADGQSSTYGGAGGSVWIITDIVEGAGVISAKGGNGNNGGGGGRIRLETGAPENYLFTGDVLANGGTATTHDGYRGHAGSVTFSDGTDITLYGTLHLGGASENTIGTLTVVSEGRLEFDGHPHGGYNAGTGLYEGQGIVINADSVDVQTSGIMSGLGLGFYGYEGPGAGWNRGGTHGGCGEGNTSPTYGSLLQPTSLGSGIAWTWGRKSGGGAIQINASGRVNVDGTITADGHSSTYGGAGGSIWINCGDLEGAGIITANGGKGTSYDGGGGRIAIYANFNCTFEDYLSNITALGGSGVTPSPNIGTVFIKCGDVIYAQPLPDLEILSSSTVTFSRINPDTNEVMDITATVHNVGTSSASDVPVVFYADGVPFATSIIPYIPIDGEMSTSIEWSSDISDVHVISVRVDPEDLILELNEENNEVTRSIIVGRGLGEIILSANISPLTTTPGSSVIIKGDAIYDTTYSAGTAVKGGMVRMILLGSNAEITHTITDGTFGPRRMSMPYTPGTYTVSVSVTDFTFEKSTNIIVTVERTQGIDLIPDTPWVTGAPRVEGDSVTIGARVHNAGTDPAGNFIVRFFADGTQIGEDIPVAGLAADIYTDVSVPWTAGPAGWRNITVTVDPPKPGAIVEYNENNNVKSCKVYVYPAKPDLTPISITFSDKTPAVDIPVTITAQIKNIGGSDANDVWVGFYDGPNHIDTVKTTPTLIPGKGGTAIAQIAHTFTWTCLRQIRVEVDPPIGTGNIEEAREDNNVLFVNICAHTPAMDLAVYNSGISFDPVSLGTEEPVTIKANICNIGEVNVADTFEVKFYDGANLIYSEPVTGIDAETSKELSFSWTTPTDAGWHTITVKIDLPENVIKPETDEYINNVASRKIYLRPPRPELYPDLRVWSEDIEFSDFNPDPNSQVAIFATIHNVGNENTAADAAVQFQVDGVQIGIQTIFWPLAAGGEITLSNTWKTSGVGSHVVEVRADWMGDIDEHNENNNDATRALIVGAYPDLAVFADDIEFSNLQPRQGQAVDISATIQNIGRADVETSFIVRFFDGDPETGAPQIGLDQVVLGLMAGSSETISVEWDTTAVPLGDHWIYVVIDQDDEILEIRDDNNIASNIIEVIPARPTAAFSAEPTETNEPGEIQFTDESVSFGTISSWFWDFGDGNTSIEEDPVNLYARDGVYTVSLTVQDEYGSDSITRVDYIIITPSATHVIIEEVSCNRHLYEPPSPNVQISTRCVNVGTRSVQDLVVVTTITDPVGDEDLYISDEFVLDVGGSDEIRFTYDDLAADAPEGIYTVKSVLTQVSTGWELDEKTTTFVLGMLEISRFEPDEDDYAPQSEVTLWSQIRNHSTTETYDNLVWIVNVYDPNGNMRHSVSSETFGLDLEENRNDHIVFMADGTWPQGLYTAQMTLENVDAGIIYDMCWTSFVIAGAVITELNPGEHPNAEVYTVGAVVPVDATVTRLNETVGIIGLTLNMEIMDPEETLFFVTDELFDLPMGTDSHQVAGDFYLGTDFVPGRYTLTATLSQGGDVLDVESTHFLVEGILSIGTFDIKEGPYTVQEMMDGETIIQTVRIVNNDTVAHTASVLVEVTDPNGNDVPLSDVEAWHTIENEIRAGQQRGLQNLDITVANPVSGVYTVSATVFDEGGQDRDEVSATFEVIAGKALVVGRGGR